LNEIIATLPEPMKGKPALGNLITDAICNFHNLDIAFHNWGGTRSNKMPKDIRLKDIYTLLPFGNHIILFEMMPAEIENLVRYDFERHGHLELFVSGITYTVKITAEKKVKDVELRDMQGNLLDDSKTYKVGINDYIVSAYKLDYLNNGKAIKTTVAECLIQYLKEGVDVTKNVNALRAQAKVLPE
jgi:2',3'-cyclic-nucleotide 2'-phosphodiesterase (5'-nucleotidase family)